MPWQFWTLLTILSFSFALITARFQRKHISAIQLMYWQYLGSLISVISILIFLKIPLALSDSTFIFAILIGLINSLGAVALMKALGYHLSKTTTLFAFKAHLSVFLFATFMSEYLIFNPQTFQGLLKLLALVLASLSIIFTLNQNQTMKKASKIWVKPAILAFVIFGFSQFFAKILATNLHPSQAAVGQYLGSFVGINLISFIRKTPLLINFRHLQFNIFRGLIVGFGWFAAYTALSTGPGSLISLTQNMGTMSIPAFFGLIFLKENKNYNFKNYLGLLLAILSIILLSS